MSNSLYRWRDLLKAGYGPKSSVTRSVLLTLNLFMDDQGTAFPATRLLARASGLSERSVCTHLEKAVREGWLKRKTAGVGGQGWKRNSYLTVIPPGKYEIQKAGKTVHIAIEGTELDSAPLEGKALNDIQHAQEKGTEPHAEGTEPHANKALNHVQCKSPKKTTKKTTRVLRPLPDDFEISEEVRIWAAKKGYTQLDMHLENFKLKCQAKNYKYANPDAAFKTAIRDNWANVQVAATNPPKQIADELY